MQMHVDPETIGRQTAVFAVCVYAFVTVKPGGLNSNVFRKNKAQEDFNHVSERSNEKRNVIL